MYQIQVKRGEQKMLSRWKKSAAEAGYGEEMEISMRQGKDGAETQIEAGMWTFESQLGISSYQS